MNTLSIEGWCKPGGAQKSTPLGLIHFHVSEPDHLRMEQAEERLQESGEKEAMIDADTSTLDLKTPEECGPLTKCQWRVYIGSDNRGHFHLVGHRVADNSLVYTNAVMVDQLG